MLLIFHKIRFDFLLIFLLYPFILFPQKNISNSFSGDFPFKHIEHLTADHGLFGDEVHWMLQDMKGFMWFITDGALNRYDGYTFRTYSYDARDSNSITAGSFYGLAEGKNGMLWFPSLEQGLYSFDPALEQFMRYRHKEGITNSLLHDRMGPIAIQNDGMIWLTTAEGLDKFDPQTKSFTHFYKGKHGITNDLIYTIIIDERDTGKTKQVNLWLVNNSPGIDHFDTKTGKVIKHFPFPFKNAGQWDPSRIMLRGMKNKTIWVGSDDKGIYGFDTEKQEYIFIKNGHHCNSKNHLDDFYYVMEDNNGNLWTANHDNELIYYDQMNNKFYFKKINYSRVSFGFTPLIFQDRSNNIWVGTNNGLMLIDTRVKNFFASEHDEKDSHSISGNFICNMTRLDQDHLLVCAQTVDIFDKRTKSFSRLSLIQDGKPVRMNGFQNCYKDSKGIVWLSGVEGIASYNPATKKSRTYAFYNDSIKLDSRSFFTVLEDRKGRYWATNMDNKGLYLFDPATGKAKTFTKESHSSLTTNSMAFLFEDSKGILYLGGWEGGFITFNAENETFKVYHHDAKDTASLSNETVSFYHEDKNGLIWYGTYGGGLGVFSPATQKFKTFTTADELPSNYVMALAEDHHGNYWVGTRKGICNFTPPEDPFTKGKKITFRNYNISDGLSSEHININAAFCDDDGTLYFGTRSTGVIYFHPDHLKDNDFIPAVHITGFSLMNKAVNLRDEQINRGVLKSTVEFTREIVLRHTQNTISFNFTALNYTHSEKNKYAYKLEGFDDDWIESDASKRFATYTNLDHGEYTFKVKASNNDGIWNETPTELRIIIKPPFWQTIWFKILVGLIVLAIAYAFYRYRVAQIILLQRIRNKIAADLHDDIGSTLNSISIYSEVAKKDISRKDFALNMIGESSRKVIDSMSDIVWSINPENDNFDKLIFRMRSLTHNLLKAKKIECVFKADESLNEVRLSMQARRNFYLIFKEALNNLVKYSQADRASVSLTHENRQVTLIVRDNGIGFDVLEKYNGNGLNNIRRRTEELNARLNIESSAGAGTTIEVNLKV